MKPKTKSALISGIFAGLCLGLAGCDNVQWPHVYGPDEVPQNVRDEPRAVAAPPAISPNDPYPRLGDVPMKPKDFTPAPQIDQQKEQMENDQAQGQAMQNQYQNSPPGTPVQ